MKMRINVSKSTYAFEGEPCYPLPLHVKWEGEVELIGRLHRTKEGDANWAIHNIETSLSRNPRIHLIGTARVETDACREFYEYRDEQALQILRLGYEGRNFRLRISFDSVKDLTKRRERTAYIKSIHEKITEEPAGIRQGHLEGWMLYSCLELPPELALSGKRTKILNHEFISGSEAEFSWVACDYSAVICCPRQQVVHIVSPDHLEDAITLTWGCCYYFTHPDPHQQAD